MSGRLFVAVELTDAVRDFVATAIARLGAAGVDARFSAREKWHATLAFLGPLPPERYATACDAVRAAAAGSTAFDIAFDVVGAFPSPKHPRVVWVGASTEQAGFASCADAVRGALEKLGFTFEEEAVPHVTVCRIKHPSKALPSVALPPAVSMHVGEVVLYESVSSGPSTRYVVRELFRLSPT